MLIKTLCSLDTIFNADCIDFCPIESYENYFVVGTYQLEEREDGKNNERVGRLYLYIKMEDKIIEKQQINMCGVLDVRWCPHLVNDQILLALVNAEGFLIVFKLNDGILHEFIKVKVSNSLALYLDWSSMVIPTPNPCISVSDSSGSVSIFILNEPNLALEECIKAHQFESWVTCFNYWNPSILYSGGDDCLFKGFDIRSKSCLLFTSKEHSAGVTSIQPSLWKEELLFSGCYAGCLNSWDTRNMKHPVTKENFDGGVWRLRCEPNQNPLMVTSLMHSGFKVLEVDKTFKTKTIGSYMEHESLAYGADWCSLKHNDKHIVGSVSFYDHLLKLWEFQC